jgi:hypothetical protein
VATLQEVLERRTEKSALLLGKVSGKIKPEPIKPDVGRPYLLARPKLQALALYEMEPGTGEEERGRMTSDDISISAYIPKDSADYDRICVLSVGSSNPLVSIPK